MIDVYVSNNTDIKNLQKKKIKEAAETVLKGERIKNAIISIVLMNNADIQRINAEYLKHDYPTDVISFKLEDDPLVGDIYIGVEVAIEQSIEYNVCLTNELKRLAVHGILHCIGYDDNTSTARFKMRALEDLYIY